MRTLVSLIAFFLAAAALADLAADDDQRAKDNLFIETLSRLEDFDLNASPKIKAKLLDVLKRHQGSQSFVELVERFKLRDQADDLVKLAIDKPNDSAGVSAAKLLLKWNEAAKLEKVIDGDDAKAAGAVLTALGYTNDARAYPMLAKVVTDKARDKPLRTAAVAALGLGRAGEKQLLALAKDGKLADDLHFAAGQVLLNSSDEAIRLDAAKVLKLPPTLSAKPLPPVAELAKRSGTAANGPAVAKKVNCIQCHRFEQIDLGADFGPNLSDIGNKLPREGLYTAILDPSAGIEHSFEGVRLQTDEGEDVVGILVSETKDDLTLKVPGGVTRKYAKASIESRDKLKTSLMPPGLQQAMTEQELIDLVEWLTTLKKAK
jgi:putative heme-binding domain-containing protein